MAEANLAWFPATAIPPATIAIAAAATAMMLCDGYAMAIGDPYDGIFELQDLAPQAAPSLLLARPGRHEGLTELPHAHLRVI